MSAINKKEDFQNIFKNTNDLNSLKYIECIHVKPGDYILIKISKSSFIQGTILKNIVNYGIGMGKLIIFKDGSEETILYDTSLFPKFCWIIITDGCER